MLRNDNLVSMGKIANVFGIHGWVKIKTSSNLNSLQDYKILHILFDNNMQTLEVEKSFIKGDIVHLKFLNINDRDQAMLLKGAIVYVSRDDFPKLADNEYYWVDLIGLKVVNKKRQELGNVDNLMETGANSVLVVKGNKQHLIPFVADYVSDVDMHNKLIIVDWGLDY